MTVYRQQIAGVTYEFRGLVDLLAKASPRRSGDELAGCAAHSDAERAAAQWALADVPLSAFLDRGVVPYDDRRGHPADHRHRTTPTRSRPSRI